MAASALLATCGSNIDESVEPGWERRVARVVVKRVPPTFRLTIAFPPLDGLGCCCCFGDWPLFICELPLPPPARRVASWQSSAFEVPLRLSAQHHVEN